MDGLEDAYILYTMPSAMHYFHAESRGDGFFFRTRKRDSQERGNLLLRERDKTSILFYFNSPWQFTSLFLGGYRGKRRENSFFFIFTLACIVY